VTELVGATVARGTGAARQRAAFERTGSLEAVVDLVVEETAG
jgi:carboxylate-amine ligase